MSVFEINLNEKTTKIESVVIMIKVKNLKSAKEIKYFTLINKRTISNAYHTLNLNSFILKSVLISSF